MRLYGPRRRGVLVAVLGLSWSVACASLSLDGDLEGPRGDPTPALDGLDFGDARNGDVTLSTIAPVNECVRLLSTDTSDGWTVLRIASPLPNLASGKRLLAVQMQNDAFALSADGNDVGADAGPAGLWSLFRLTEIRGDGSLIVDRRPSTIFRTDLEGYARAQLCTVPEYGNLVIPASTGFQAVAWNGTSGGIVAVLADGVVTLNLGATLSATAVGFRGGPPNPCGADAVFAHQLGNDYKLEDKRGGGKGEGLDLRSYLFAETRAGRGNLANAGGGGNGRRAGGGGGGNGGAGGRGGREAATGSPAVSDLATGGLGGARVVATAPDRLLFGGGGGSGHCDDQSDGRLGAAGGGIVLVAVRTLQGQGTISADGAAGTPASGGGGAGGGGAGGTILVRVDDATQFTGRYSAAGGDGGGLSVVSESATGGPGGGGGGGHLFVTATAAVGTVVDVGGGDAGAQRNATGQTHLWAQQPGQAGVSEP